MSKIFYAILLILFVLDYTIFAQDIIKDNPAPVETTITKTRMYKDWGIGGHPIAGYDDKSKLTLGAACVIYFEPEDKNQDIDEIQFSSTYNWAKQYDLMTSYNKYFKDNIWSVDGTFGYKNYPDDYNDEEYKAVYLPFEIGAAYKLRDKIYVGPLYEFQYGNTEFIDKNAEAVRDDISGNGKMYISGLGGQFIYKNIPTGQLYRRQGNIFTISSILFSPVFLSSYQFAGVHADYRHYIPVMKKCVLAFQVEGKTVMGDVPFQYIPSLEAKDLLRGGSDQSGRHFIAGQTEFRFPIIWRFGGTVFVGAGETKDHMKIFGSDPSVAGGTGFRIALNKKQSINLRFDLAVNEKGEVSKYIKIKEAF